MKKYFLNELNFISKNAGFKARSDVVEIVKKEHGIRLVNIPLWGGVISRLKSLPIFLKTFLFVFKKNDIVYIQYPFPKPFSNLIFIIKKVKKIKLSLIIHDIDFLRGEEKNDELKKINKSYCIIC